MDFWRHFWTLKCKNTKLLQNLLIRIFEILIDEKHSKGSKSYCFFILQYHFDSAQRTPLQTFSGGVFCLTFFIINVFYLLFHCFVYLDSFSVRTSYLLLVWNYFNYAVVFWLFLMIYYVFVLTRFKHVSIWKK